MLKKLLLLFSVLLLLPATSFAVVTIAQFGTATTDSSDGSSYSGPTGTPGANHTLVAFVSATATVASATMTGGSLTWTRETSVNYNSTSTLYMFWANSGASPGATTVVFDCTGDAATGANIAVFEVSGSDVVTSDPIKQFKSAIATSTDPTVTLDAAITITNGGIYAVGVGRSAPAYATPESGTWAEIVDSGHSSPNDGIEAADRIGTTVSTVTPTGASGAWGIIAAEVYASGAGPTSGTLLLNQNNVMGGNANRNGGFIQ